MNPALLTLALALPLLTTPQTADPMQTPRQLAHISTTFSFQLAAPLAPLAARARQPGRRLHRPARPPHQHLGQHRI